MVPSALLLLGCPYPAPVMLTAPVLWLSRLPALPLPLPGLQIMEIASFEKFLTDKIKVGNKTGEQASKRVGQGGGQMGLHLGAAASAMVLHAIVECVAGAVGSWGRTLRNWSSSEKADSWAGQQSVRAGDGHAGVGRHQLLASGQLGGQEQHSRWTPHSTWQQPL